MPQQPQWPNPQQNVQQQRPMPQQPGWNQPAPVNQGQRVMGGTPIMDIPIEDRLPDGSFKLRFLSNPEKGEVILSSGSWIGRHSTCALMIEDKCMSRNHCRIEFMNGKWVMQLSGSNGVRVNGQFFSSRTAVPILLMNHSRLEFASETGRNIMLEFLCNP